MPRRTLTALAAALVAALLLAGCGSDGGSGDAAAETTGSVKQEAPTTVRLGYFPNITHATAIAGVEKGFFQKALGDDKLEVSTFNAGPAASQALLAGAI